MPSSFPENISPIIQIVGQLKPQTVLDIGFGRGKYGFLLKEYYFRMLKRIDGVEVFADYVTALQKMIYDNITIGNIFEIPLLPYDVYLLVDVLEHWEKEPTHMLMERMLRAGGKILISTPRSIGEQGAEFGNELERHITQWLPPDFNRYEKDEIHSECSFMYVLKGLCPNP